MNILVVSQHFWPEDFRINDVVKTLKQKGCNVTVLSGHPNYPSGRTFAGYSAWKIRRQLHSAGYEIVRVPMFVRGRGRNRNLFANYLSFVLSASLLGPFLLRRQKFDVVLVYALSPILQGIPAAILARSKRVPLVAWIQDLWPESLFATDRVRNQTVLRTAAIVTKWIYRRCSLLLVQSEAFVRPVRELAGDSIPIVYHPNAGEPDLENTDNTEMPERFTVLFAGNLGAAQSLRTILGAAKKLLSIDPTIALLIAGSGSCFTWFKNELEHLQLNNVSLLGRVPASEMPEVYKRASALLVTLKPDVGISQTIPSKIQSYLAVGKPIIGALDGEGARVINKSGGGVVVPAEDERALVEAILQLRSMTSQDLIAIGSTGRKYYETHFTPNLLADQLIDHFSNLINGEPCNQTSLPENT